MEINLKLKCCGHRHCVWRMLVMVAQSVRREILVGLLVLLTFCELAAVGWSTVKACGSAKKWTICTVVVVASISS